MKSGFYLSPCGNTIVELVDITTLCSDPHLKDMDLFGRVMKSGFYLSPDGCEIVELYGVGILAGEESFGFVKFIRNPYFAKVIQDTWIYLGE